MSTSRKVGLTLRVSASKPEGNEGLKVYGSFIRMCRALNSSRSDFIFGVEEVGAGALSFVSPEHSSEDLQRLEEIIGHHLSELGDLVGFSAADITVIIKVAEGDCNDQTSHGC